MVDLWKKAPHFQNPTQRTVAELEKEIAFVEGFPVWLTCDTARYFRPYPLSHASPSRMRGHEWVEQFEKLYPDIELKFLNEALTLGELRKNPSP